MKKIIGALATVLVALSLLVAPTPPASHAVSEFEVVCRSHYTGPYPDSVQVCFQWIRTTTPDPNDPPGNLTIGGLEVYINGEPYGLKPYPGVAGSFTVQRPDGTTKVSLDDVNLGAGNDWSRSLPLLAQDAGSLSPTARLRYFYTLRLSDGGFMVSSITTNVVR